jgi:hypothetical protein
MGESTGTNMLPIERITQAIVVLRERKVLLDADLADLRRQRL